MSLPLPIPRFHLFEIDDQPWFPPTFRGYVQACLTLLWNLHTPILQPASPAHLVAKTLQSVLGASLPSYTFVDFCAGAGGPTPSIERAINRTPHPRRRSSTQNNNRTANGGGGAALTVSDAGVDFVLTDLHPHLAAWSLASGKSDNLSYVPGAVDAANAPKDLLSMAGHPSTRRQSGKIMRLFSLAFHHFPDPLARDILRNTLDTSAGFAIFELQGRDVGNLGTVLMLGPLLWLGSWYWFWGQWGHLFWTYVVPVVPFVVVYDGLVSCLRTRREGEVLALMRQVGVWEGWRVDSGSEVHTWPGGRLQWFVGVKEGG